MPSRSDEFVGGPRVASLEKKLGTTARCPACRVLRERHRRPARRPPGPRREARVEGRPSRTSRSGQRSKRSRAARRDPGPDRRRPRRSPDEPRGARSPRTTLTASTPPCSSTFTAGRRHSLKEIRAFCRERGIGSPEDGAQCFGVEAFGEPVLASATIGDALVLPGEGRRRRDGWRRDDAAVGRSRRR